MSNDSQWVQKRHHLVENFVQGRTLLAAILSDPDLGRDTLLALRDEIKNLRTQIEDLVTTED